MQHVRSRITNAMGKRTSVGRLLIHLPAFQRAAHLIRIDWHPGDECSIWRVRAKFFCLPYRHSIGCFCPVRRRCRTVGRRLVRTGDDVGSRSRWCGRCHQNETGPVNLARRTQPAAAAAASACSCRYNYAGRCRLKPGRYEHANNMTSPVALYRIGFHNIQMKWQRVAIRTIRGKGDKWDGWD